MFDSQEFVRCFLAIYFVMIGLYFTCRSYAMSEREGYSFIAYGEKFSKTWWHRHCFNIFRGAILAACVLRLFYDIDVYLGVFASLMNGPLPVFGVFFLLLGFSMVSYVAGYMNRDWYSGVAPGVHHQELVTDGPFSRSRNPLFLGIITGQIGFFLALPSVFSLVCLIVGAGVIMRQALTEEQALQKRFGSQYQEYCLRTSRWWGKGPEL